MKYLFPKHVMDKVVGKKEGYVDLTDEFYDVTILFADISNFTKCI